MSTEEIAKIYHELANQSQWDQIINELHADEVICQEPAHVAERGLPVITKGKEALKAKGAANRMRIEAIHEQHCSEPQIGGDYFTMVLKRDVTFKGQPRMQLEEIGVYQVKEGKIVLEQFFY